MRVYFVTAGRADEIEAIKHVKPDRLLVSYFYFRNKSLGDFIETLGYKPKILLDSGAYTAFTTGRNISPIDYMDYIERNNEFIDRYVSLDVIGDEVITRYYYEIMKYRGFNPIPVYHYGDLESSLKWYIEAGADLIALGGTVPIKNKNTVAEWVKGIVEKYPDIKFHLLGSSSQKITSIGGLYSCDSSTWIMQAKNGRPYHIIGKTRKAKIDRAIYNLRAIGG